MNLPDFYPAWLFLFFAVSGTIAMLLVSLLFWAWLKTTAISTGAIRRGFAWNATGFAFMFSSSWFVCGIGAGPGLLLSNDPGMHQPLLASGAAALGMLCSLAGWACFLIGMKTMLRGLERHAVVTSSQTPV